MDQMSFLSPNQQCYGKLNTAQPALGGLQPLYCWLFDVIIKTK